MLENHYVLIVIPIYIVFLRVGSVPSIYKISVTLNNYRVFGSFLRVPSTMFFSKPSITWAAFFWWPRIIQGRTVTNTSVVSPLEETGLSLPGFPGGDTHTPNKKMVYKDEFVWIFVGWFEIPSNGNHDS